MSYADIPEFTDMCTWFKEAADKGYFGKNFASDTWDYTSEVLGTGEAAMLFCWDTWFDTDYDSESYDYVAMILESCRYLWEPVMKELMRVVT